MKDFSFYNEYFNIQKILESGQFFNYNKINESYELVFNKEIIKIKTINNVTTINKPEKFYENYLKTFFDMNTDYEKLSNELIIKFPELKEYISFGKGIRFINQDFLLASISFIISQNNNMSRIKKSIDMLTKKYGEQGHFPNLEKLKKLSKEDWKNLGVGFRDKYLYNFVQNIDENFVENISKMNTQEAYKELLNFKGIGPKVANCILLFGLNKRDVFPVDTHIRQIMLKLYFDEEKSNKEIENFALNKFGNYSAYIQQCLFYWKINNK